MTFDHEPLQNRVLTVHNTTNSWQRLSKIVNETGASTQIRYTLPECTAANLPEAPRNGMRCYPVLGPDPANPNADMVEYWHKYLVDSITETDIQLAGGVQSPPMVTKYTYGGAPGWHYADDDGLTRVNRKTWSQFRGYEWVTTQVGAGAAKTLTKTKYLRGMHGDRASYTGGTRTVPSTASLGDETVYDEDAFAGMVRETIVYNGTESLEVSKTVHVPWQSEPTASRTINGDRVDARYLRNQTTYTAVAVGKDGARGWRKGRTHTEYDGVYGTVKSEKTPTATWPSPATRAARPSSTTATPTGTCCTWSSAPRPRYCRVARLRPVVTMSSPTRGPTTTAPTTSTPGRPSVRSPSPRPSRTGRRPPVPNGRTRARPPTTRSAASRS